MKNKHRFTPQLSLYSLINRTGFLSALLFICLCLPAWAQNTQPKYAIIPENPLPGEFVTIALNTQAAKETISAALYTNENKRLAKTTFFQVPDIPEKIPVLAAILTVPNTAQAGFAYIKIESTGASILEIPLIIRERKFTSEVIDLNKALTSIRTDYDPQKTLESEQLWAILSKTGATLYSTGKFTEPVSSTRRTSFYGDRRLYKYSNSKTDSSVHAGIDYGIPTGTPIYACAAGKVVLAKYRIVTGNSVVIEHAPGIYSLYYHLEKIEIHENELVQTGTFLGLSGATGLATGPHLHWEIRVSGEAADPDIFLHRPILDKDAILAKITK